MRPAVEKKKYVGSRGINRRKGKEGWDGGDIFPLARPPYLRPPLSRQRPPPPPLPLLPFPRLGGSRDSQSPKEGSALYFLSRSLGSAREGIRATRETRRKRRGGWGEVLHSKGGRDLLEILNAPRAFSFLTQEGGCCTMSVANSTTADPKPQNRKGYIQCVFDGGVSERAKGGGEGTHQEPLVKKGRVGK